MGAVLCYPQDTELWGGFLERCRFEDDMVIVTMDTDTFMLRPYDEIVVVRYTTEDGFSIVEDISPYISDPEAQRAYQPDRLLNPAGDLPTRLTTLFGNS